MVHGSQKRGGLGLATICRQNARMMVCKGFIWRVEASLHS